MKITNQFVIDTALKHGFTLVGFAKVEKLESETARLQEWLNSGYHASMQYMENNFVKRNDIKNVFSSAKSVISLAMNYYTSHDHTDRNNFGKISRYAWGKDYHLIIWKKLNEIILQLKKGDDSFEAISYVDTGPVMDKAWAVRAGIGWQGKHSNIINPTSGSWFFIANIFCNYEFDYSEQITDHCGTCTACIDACPTMAIVSEYIVDANKCISFQTIENKGEIDEQLRGKFENWIFGCDICQDVCPWNNKFSFITEEENFFPKNNEVELELYEVLRMDQEKFSKRFKDSPIKRTKLRGIKRNAEFLLPK